jgi:orotidine-5'-phosphate decarboxylase
MTFYYKLFREMRKSNSLLCIGLDTDEHKIPDCLRGRRYPQFVFNKAIIDVTHDLVCAYKPNSAFYEARGDQGITELKMTCDYLYKKYPDVVIILDAKRADIGNTNNGYVAFAFDYLGVDAITLHPYLGREAVQPFLDRKEKGSLILCRTSNPGAGEFQDLSVGSTPLYQILAKNIVEKWNINKNCALVVGATYPEELKIVRRIVKDMPLLIPGIGTQGGDIKKTVSAGIDSHGSGAIINASRSVIFASSETDFAQKARQEAQKLRDEINRVRIATYPT